MKYRTNKHGLDAMVIDLTEKLEPITVSSEAVDVGMGVSFEDDGASIQQYKDVAVEVEQAFMNVIESYPEVLASAGISMESLSDEGLDSDAVELASMSGILANNVAAATDFSYKPASESDQEISLGAFNPHNIDVSMESFDERDISKLKSYTMITNLFAGYGTEFSRAVAPLYTSSPDESGIQLIVDLMYVQDDTKHETSGVLSNWNRKSLTRAMVDGSILDHNATDIVPVYRDADNKDKFADIADWPTNIEKVGAVKVTTAPLKPNVKFNIKGLSMTDELVKSGAMDYTDTIEPDFSLDTICLDVAGEKIKFPVGAEITSVFQASRQAASTGMNLNFDSDSIIITGETINAAGDALAGDLAVIKNNGWTVHLTTSIGGRVDVQSGDMTVFMNEVNVHEIVDGLSKSVDLETGEGKTLVDAINGHVEFEGYVIKGRFSDLNLRHDGTHITTSMYVINHIVGIDPPIRIKRPPSQINAFKDTSRDLQALIKTLNVRSDNKVVRTLRETASKLAIFQKAKFSDESSNPQLFGAGNLFVRPMYLAKGLDVAAVINSIRSQDKHKDVKAIISDAMYIQALNLWTNSGLRAAVESLPPGYTKVPTFVIACDPKLESLIDMSRYSNKQFKFEVTSSPNQDMLEKAYGFFRFSNESSPSPLTAFFSSSAPHIVFNNNVSNGGSGAIKLLSVFPRFRVFANCPVMLNLTITNIDEAFVTKTPA